MMHMVIAAIMNPNTAANTDMSASSSPTASVATMLTNSRVVNTNTVCPVVNQMHDGTAVSAPCIPTTHMTLRALVK